MTSISRRVDSGTILAMGTGNNYNFVRKPNECRSRRGGLLRKMKTSYTMKRVYTLMILTFSLGLLAQEGPKISTAVIAFERNNDLADAKKYIDEATEIINTKDKSSIRWKDLRKYYYYNGIIHLRIASSEDPEVLAMEPDAIDIAAENLANVIEYEASIGKESYTDRAKEQLPYVANLYAARGIEKAGGQEFMAAYEDFMKTYQMKQELNMGTDTSMYYNAALMAQNAKNYEKALPIYEDLIDMQYKGVIFKADDPETGETKEFQSKIMMTRAVEKAGLTNPRVEGDLRPDLYVNAANLYLQSGDTAKYDQMVAVGREKFPENEALLRAELQKFLETEQYDKALVNLNQAVENDPENKLFHYIKGYILQTSMKDHEAARVAYAQSIKLDSNYLEPQYMTGLSYIEEANKLSEEMNALPLNATSKYKELKKKQEKAFENARPYFESAYRINPKDPDTLNALKEVYYKLKMADEAMKIQEEINALEAGS